MKMAARLGMMNRAVDSLVVALDSLAVELGSLVELAGSPSEYMLTMHQEDYMITAESVQGVL